MDDIIVLKVLLIPIVIMPPKPLAVNVPCQATMAFESSVQPFVYHPPYITPHVVISHIAPRICSAPLLSEPTNTPLVENPLLSYPVAGTMLSLTPVA
jgi:hypothetical protein